MIIFRGKFFSISDGVKFNLFVSLAQIFTPGDQVLLDFSVCVYVCVFWGREYGNMSQRQISGPQKMIKAIFWSFGIF